MRFTPEKVKAINSTYADDKKNSHVESDINLELIDSCLEGMGVYKNGWHICNVEDIDDMIKELQRISACIQFETGIMEF